MHVIYSNLIKKVFRIISMGCLSNVMQNQKDNHKYIPLVLVDVFKAVGTNPTLLCSDSQSGTPSLTSVITS